MGPAMDKNGWTNGWSYQAYDEGAVFGQSCHWERVPLEQNLCAHS